MFSLEGLQACTNLEILELLFHGGPDLTPLAGLTKLKKLYLDPDFNQTVIDLTPIVNLPELVEVVVPKLGHHPSHEKFLANKPPSRFRNSDTMALPSAYHPLVDALEARLEDRFAQAHSACQEARRRGGDEDCVVLIEARVLAAEGRHAEALARLRSLPWHIGSLEYDVFIASQKSEMLRRAYDDKTLWLGAVNPEGYLAIVPVNGAKAHFWVSAGNGRLDVVPGLTIPNQAASCLGQVRGALPAEAATALAKAAFFCFQAEQLELAMALCQRALQVDPSNALAGQSLEALRGKGVGASQTCAHQVEEYLSCEILSRSSTVSPEASVLERQLTMWTIGG